MDVRDYFVSVSDLLQKVPFEAVDRVVEALAQANCAGQTIYICGNGGSATTATHFGCDLAQRTRVTGQPRFRVISLTENTALMTALSNDIGYENVFAEQLLPLIRSGDVLIAISGSGNSRNVLKAVDVARDVDAITVGFSGFDGGKLAPMVDISVHVPSFNMPMVEDVHLILEHAICERLLALNQAAASMVIAASSNGKH